jgi:hypothetical protein
VQGTPSATLTPQPVVITATNQNSTGTFVPSWTVETNSLIAGMAPSATIGNAGLGSGAGGGGTVVLTDGVLGTTGDSATTASLGSGGGACSSLTYTLTNSANGYDLTNIVTYSCLGRLRPGRAVLRRILFHGRGADDLHSLDGGRIQSLFGSAFVKRRPTGLRLSSLTGVLARNVYSVKFDFPQDNTIDYGSGSYQEIILQGTKSAPLPVTISLNHFPEPMQLYPRNLATSLANVLVDGSVTSAGATQVVVSVLRNGSSYTNVTQSLTYSNGDRAVFHYRVHLGGTGQLQFCGLRHEGWNQLSGCQCQ